MKDSLIPQNRDHTHSTLRHIGESPNRTYISTHYYEDGSVREFNGREWSLIQSSEPKEAF